MLQIIILLVVFILIAVRHIGRHNLPMYAVMAVGGLLSVLTGGISPSAAIKAIDWTVILFLAGMFCAGQLLEISGWMAHIEYKIFRRASNKRRLMTLFVIFMGLGAALFMNDTMAVIGVPVLLLMAKEQNISPETLALALAYAVTVGSAASPIGNPQNLIIAVKGGLASPFLDFARYLFLPTLINLFIVCAAMRIFYPKEFSSGPVCLHDTVPADHSAVVLARITAALVFVAMIAKALLAAFMPSADFSILWIAAIAAAPGLLFSNHRKEIITGIDWRTLVFFMGMFVLMQSVWDTGIFQSMLERTGMNISSVPSIAVVSVIMSQLISNVPLTALYIPLLQNVGAEPQSYMALAACATIAGNLFVLGAASNVIIFQSAERHGVSMSVWRFTKIGLPLTIVNTLVYMAFLA